MPNKEECPKLVKLIDNLTCFSDHVELMTDHALRDYINLSGLYYNELICILLICKLVHYNIINKL